MWLSVVVPTYQGARWLPQALESVRTQEDLGACEVVAVDDGSTDGTVEVLRRFAESMPLRILQPPRTGNWIHGTNLGLREARGAYACVLHQDDAWLPGRARAVRAEVQHQPALVVHPSVFVDEGGAPAGHWRCPLPRVRGPVEPRVFVSRLLVQNFLAMPAPVFDRALALQTGGLDESLWYAGDWDLWLRLGRRGPVRYIPEPLTAFRIHPASQTVARRTESEERRSQLQTVLERHQDAVDERSARAAATYSIDVNVALAAVARGEPVPALSLLAGFARLGPSAQARYLRDSRIVERVLSRLRLRHRLT
jgi:GT2 family glycosyltransferase